MSLPTCGLYRTTVAIGAIEAGRLVYFHNHGDPGPGIYPPADWQTNRARFSERGVTLTEPGVAQTLEPLLAEGLYRVTETFTCCAQACRTFEAGLLVQLGYNGAGQGLLFLPHWHQDGLHLPGKGFKLEQSPGEKLQALTVDKPVQRSDSETLQ